MIASPRLRARLSFLALALAAAGCATTPRGPVTLNLVAINDFHGNLEPSKYEYTSAATGTTRILQAGGIEALSGALSAWRREDKDLLFIGAGDLIGASPALSSMWADEPSIEAMNLLGLRMSSVGNHEFDGSAKELLRQQHGGCDSPRPSKACKLAPDFRGARFPYLAANVFDSATGKPFMPGYRIESVKGVKVGVVGAVLQDTASVAMSSAIAGLRFIDEAEAINRALPKMRAEGAQVVVVLIHEGGRTKDAPDQPNCQGLTGPVVDIVKKLDPAYRLVITGHSHQGYLCKVDDRVVTQADAAGHLLSRIAVKYDPASDTVQDIDVRNVVMDPLQFPADPKVAAYLASVRERSRVALARPVGKLGAALVTRQASDSGESPLGDLIADAALAATRSLGAQIGFMNNGGIRKDLEASSADLTATFGQVQAVLPFGNTLFVMDLTGAQLRRLLEQQWQRPSNSSVSLLQISHTLSYTWDEKRPLGSRLVPGSLKVNGQPVEDGKTYRVVANNFLAEGGDNYPEFAKGTNRVATQIVDLDALSDYIARNPGAGAANAALAPTRRIDKVRQ
ncbi:bifunctional metallophosphatase/5'-nucleotidase [Massilia sp. Dwa41.01b]|uniref:bifunctional metallophosphatase/5'-nucleotidase n=1 Tax=unclassified Massilia TaxID=2609279 RepID=UPI0015FF2599|nr:MULTISPECIES: bifunctional metallophosphatase/5'-nucleotidase [unclassified Massilia]QNA88087.1 bifunctional metallophosphatase/5'-nucleotidase [Massilia sp. Dwa41.01b]QNA98996.1 bifunctional metallophosphatase/5'-nucleotidase [Massilia sp. Se16.2.3]